MTQLKLAIGIPAYGGRVVAEHARMFLEIGHTLALSHGRFHLVSSGYLDVCRVDRARNELLFAAVRAHADWLLMIDADTWVVSAGDEDAGYQLLRMISEADRAGAAIVGAPVIRRRAGGEAREITAYRYPHDRPYSEREPWIPPAALSDSEVREELQEVDALGTAVFAVNLNRTGGVLFRFTDDFGEDLEYCRQVKQIRGGKILLDGRVRTAHLSRPYPLLSKEDE